MSVAKRRRNIGHSNWSTTGLGKLLFERAARIDQAVSRQCIANRNETADESKRRAAGAHAALTGIRAGDAWPQSP
jgi:hypothetical protein